MHTIVCINAYKLCITCLPVNKQTSTQMKSTECENFKWSTTSTIIYITNMAIASVVEWRMPLQYSWDATSMPNSGTCILHGMSAWCTYVTLCVVRPTLMIYSACWSSYVRLLSLLVGLIQEFHALAVKTAPVMAVKEKMQGLSEDPRKLLEKLLKLFAQVCMHMECSPSQHITKYALTILST